MSFYATENSLLLDCHYLVEATYSSLFTGKVKMGVMVATVEQTVRGLQHRQQQ